MNMIEKFLNIIERGLNNHFGKVSFLLICSVIFIYLIPIIPTQVPKIIQNLFHIYEIKETISLEFTLTTIGAIIAFWYGFKRYERDKEIEIVINFGKEKTDYENISAMVQNWLIAFNLNQKKYLSDEIWNIIDKNNKRYLLIQILNTEKEIDIISELYYLGKIDKKLINHILNYINNEKSDNDEWRDQRLEYFSNKINIILSFTP